VRRAPLRCPRPLMVVCDFDLVGITTLPAEADTVLVIDTDTVLPDAIPSQPFELIARRH